jgi:hypothetical protein
MSTFVPSYSLLHSIGAVALSSLVIGCLAEPDEVIDESTEPGTIGESEAVAAPKATGPLGGALWSTSDALCTHAGAKAYTGDFNGDGRDDLLCHDREGGTWIDYTDASGRLGGSDAFVDTNFCTHAGATLYVGRFNGDVKDDLLCHDGEGGTWIDYADANGRFNRHDTFGDVNFCLATGGKKLHVGDFNGDLRDDLLCIAPTGSTQIDYNENDAVRFAGWDWWVDIDFCTHAGAKLLIGDTNADGRDDLLCHDSNGGIWIDRASATGGFERHDWFGDTNFCTHAGAKLLLTDVSGDGRGDLVCHDDGGATWVDRATATGTFSGHDFFSDEFCEAPATVYAGRFSSDGRADLLCHGDGTLAIATSGL